MSFQPQRLKPQQQPDPTAGLLVCCNDHLMTIWAHRDRMWITKCRYCGQETAFTEEHPYFNHPKAQRNLGDTIRLPTFKDPAAEEPQEPQAPKPPTLTPSISVGDFKMYVCKTCRRGITEEQARGTFADAGHPLCPVCYGKYME